MKTKTKTKDRTLTRARSVAIYVTTSKCTVREAATHFGVSKTTIHKDIIERSKIASPFWHQQAMKVLRNNKEDRARRGGLATQEIWHNRALLRRLDV
jgi:putative DeoR family transcriptional regulator (stage III sporulation protein D)